MKRVFVGPLLHLVYRPWVRGAENVPEEGAAIMASNHLAVIDSFFLPLVLDRERDRVACRMEVVYVHVDMAARRASVMPDDVAARADAEVAAHPWVAGVATGLTLRSPS